MRRLAGKYWDLVVDLARVPGHAASAVAAVRGADHWVFVSSCSVYADHSLPGLGEEADLLPALDAEAAYSAVLYGQAKAGCEALTLAGRGGQALLVRPGLIGGPGDGSGRSTYWLEPPEQ